MRHAKKSTNRDFRMTFKEVPESEPVEQEAQEEDIQDQNTAEEEVCYQTVKDDMQTSTEMFESAMYLVCVLIIEPSSVAVQSHGLSPRCFTVNCHFVLPLCTLFPTDSSAGNC